MAADQYGVHADMDGQCRHGSSAEWRASHNSGGTSHWHMVRVLANLLLKDCREACIQILRRGILNRRAFARGPLRVA